MRSARNNLHSEKNPNGRLVNLTLTPTLGGRIRNVSTVAYQAHGHSGASVRKFVGDEMDKYLNAQGFVRRSLPGRLEETLFRAVSETVYNSQSPQEVSTVEKRIKEHLEVERKSRRIVEGSPGPQDKLCLVRSASACYNLNIVVYSLPSKPPVVIQSARLEDKTPSLCLYDMGHKYDFIYTMKMHESLAVAQGILYKDLYCKVFDFNEADIDGIVNRIRRDAETHSENNGAHLASSSSTSLITGNVRPVIPYSAAKSIDSSIYRNVPFDLANRMVKMQKTHGNSPGGVRFPPESHCLARRGDKFECAKVVELVEKDIRLVRFLDNAHVQLSTRDLRGRGMLYSSVSQADVSKQQPELQRKRNSAAPSMSSPEVGMHGHAAPVVTALYSPASMTGRPVAYHLPPTYYVNNSSHHNSIEAYFGPESPKCTWWDKNLGQLNEVAEDQYDMWSFTDAFENAAVGSIDEDITPPTSYFVSSSDSRGTFSPSSLVSNCNVPFITKEQLKKVDKSASFSFDDTGRDLPTDMNTLRYFFNLGLLKYQEQENDYQDVSFSSSVSVSASDLLRSDGEATPAPFDIPMPQFEQPLGVYWPQSPPQEFINFPGFYFPPPSPAVLPVNNYTDYGFNGNEDRFFF